MIVQEATWEPLHTFVWCSSIFGKILHNFCNLAKSFSGNFRSLYWLSKTFHSGTGIGGGLKGWSQTRTLLSWLSLMPMEIKRQSIFKEVCLDTVTDFLIKLGMKTVMHLVEITSFSLNNVTVRPTKIMNRGHIFSTSKINIFKKNL